jgi:predicted amidohydrolase
MTNSESYRAAVVQTLAALGDLDENIRLLRDYTAEAVRQGASLVVFPECMNSGYLFDSPEHCRALAEPTNGLYVEAIASLSKQYGIHIASGFTELDSATGRLFNSGLLLDPRGELILHYQKQFLATHDQNWFEFGERGCPVVETELGRLGLLICFDGRIPEISRALALQGVDVVIDMANFFAMDQAELWVPARAFENGVWFVAATKAGVERSIYYPGGSMIVAPDGSVKARIDYDVHGVVSAPIVPGDARRKAWREGGDRFADRRPAAYQLLARPFEETPASRFVREPLVPESSTVKVAAIQSHARLGMPEATVQAFEMLDHAAKLGVKVAVFPQFFACPVVPPSEYAAELVARDATALTERAREIARRHHCVVVLPLFEREGEKVYSSAVLVGRDDALLGRHRQVHLEPELAAWCTPGESFSVFETPYGRVGVILGYDGQFPEATRALSLAGADLIAWPCAWRELQERALLAVPKSADNRVYTMCANRTDAPYPGGSLVIPPGGFPHWNLDLVAPPVLRHGAVAVMHAELAASRQKLMIPKVHLLKNRAVAATGAILTR